MDTIWHRGFIKYLKKKGLTPAPMIFMNLTGTDRGLENTPKSG